MDQANSSAGNGTIVRRKETVKQKLAREVRQFLRLFLYLWVMFALLMLHESVVLARYNIPFTRYGYALVTALVLAKVMLLMEDFNIGRALDGKPLIYPILFKSVVYAVVFLAFYVTEETVGGLLRGKTVAESIPLIGGGTPQGYALAFVIGCLALVPYFTFSEISRAVGADRLHALLFGNPGKPSNRPGEPAHQA